MTAADDVAWASLVTVGTVARAHGLTGQVVVATESPGGERVQPGARVRARLGPSSPVEELDVAHASPFQGRWLVRFAGIDTREAAERLHGAELRVEASALPTLPDGMFYHHALVGCEVMTAAGARIGRVSRVEGGTGQSMLVVDEGETEVLIPLVQSLCPVIDTTARRIVVDPPEGLLDLNR